METKEQVKHTLGPWRVGEGGMPSRLNVWDVWAGAQIAHVKRFPVADDVRQIQADAEAEANARLIAAAPDLLEALCWMRSCFDEHGELRETYDDQCSVSLEKADAAIAKAEGR